MDGDRQVVTGTEGERAASGSVGRAARSWGGILALGAVYLVTAWLGLLLARPGTNATAVWLPTGIAIAAVLLWGRRVWPGVFIGSAIVNAWLLHKLGLGLPAALAGAAVTAAGNTAEALLAGYLVERVTGTRNPFERSRNVLSFIVLGALASSAVGALVGVSCLCTITGNWSLFGQAALTWWLGDATGALLVVPLAMTFSRFPGGRRGLRERGEFLFFATGTGVLWWASVSQIPALKIAFIPWIALVGVRLGLFYSSAVVLLLAGLATWGTVEGATTFGADTPFESLLLQQAFIGSIAFATLILGSTVREMEGERRRLRNAYRFERDVFDGSPMGMSLCTMDGRFVEVNPACAALLGRSVAETLAMTYWQATPHEYWAAESANLEDLARRGRYGPFEKEFVRPDGSRVPVRLSGRLIDREGRPFIWSTAEDISDRQAAEEALRESEERLRSIQDNLPDSYVYHFTYDTDGMPRFLYLSAGVEKLNGVRVVEVLRNAAVLRGQTDPAQLPALVAAEEESRRTMADFVTELRMRRPDGEWRWVQLRSRPRLGADGRVVWDGVATDVTARRLTEAALEESEHKYRELVENANSIILRWGPDGRISFLNEFGLRFFGYSSEEIVGRHLVGTLVPETESGGRDLGPLMERISADPASFESNINENISKDGRRSWISWTNKLVQEEGGRVLEILSVGSDITEQKKIEDELARYRENLEDLVRLRTAELAEAKERAEAADRIKSAFLATMSHELRTPLNSIIGFTGILLQGIVGPLNEEQRKQLGMVRDSSTHLLQLINDVLDISKIEAGQLVVNREPFDLRESVMRCLSSARLMAEAKGISLEARVAPSVGVIESDRRRVEQIILNLLSNAVKFTERGGVRLECRRAGSEVRIEVVDTGIGISPGDLDGLFKPFRQVDTGLTRKYEGTGLGLSICKKLAELLGGTIGVTSEWGRGSTFFFTLPAEGGEP